MRALVIGGTGMIGAAVTHQLVERGAAVTVMHRGQTPCRFGAPTPALRVDRRDRAAFERTLRESGRWDCVIDMIGSDPADAESLVRACRGRTAQLIFCSSTNVYPKPADRYPVHESHRLGSAFKNGLDKAQCERIHREAEQAGAYALTIIRPGHTYGETGSVLHSLGHGTAHVDRLRRGKPVLVHGDGQGLWSALHADDVAGVFAAAAGNATALGRDYNACGEHWFTWDQYQTTLASAAGAPPPEIVHVPSEVLGQIAPERAAQCLRSLRYPGIYDMTAARRDLGFRQSIPLEDGLRRTVEWLDGHGRIEPWPSDPLYDDILRTWLAASAALQTPIHASDSTLSRHAALCPSPRSLTGTAAAMNTTEFRAP